jgi:hypothetical protein
MKKDQVKLGGEYLAKVSGKVVPVRIDKENPHGGWDATSAASGKSVRIKSAQRLRGAVKGEKATAKNADPDLVPLTTIDKEKRDEKKTKGKAKASAVAAKKADAKPKSLSCLDAAAQVLKAKGEAMNCKAMIDAMFSAKLWHSDAPTPAATLSSAILREVSKKGKDARFKIVDRGQFVFNA